MRRFFQTELKFSVLIVFIVDYIFRWITADYKLNDEKITSFLRFPFRLISIIDLMSIVALICSISQVMAEFKITEVFVVFRVIRVFRYSKNVQTILQIFKNSKKPLFAVGSLAVGYILISAIIIFNVEPNCRILLTAFSMLCTGQQFR